MIVPVFNAAGTLARALESVRAQDYDNIQIVVVDDASTEGVSAIQELTRKFRAALMIAPENAGPGAARNRGARASDSDWLVFLDADDALDRDAIATLATEATVGRGLLKGLHCTETGQIGDGFLAGTFAVGRSVFEDVGGYDAALRFAENTDLYERVRDRLRDLELDEYSVAAPLVRLSGVGRSRNYDQARFEACVHLLNKNRERLDGTPQRATLQGIAAVNAARLGWWSTAVRYAAAAVASEPLRLRHAARLGITLLGPFARPYWRRQRAQP